MSVNSIAGVVTPKSTVSRYEWHITDFCTVCKNVGEYLYSPEFATCNSKCMIWRLHLYPKGDKNDNRDFISLFAYYLGNEKATVTVKFSLLNSGNVELQEIYTSEGNCTAFANGGGYSRYVNRSFIYDPKNKLLVNDTLKVFCEITFVPDIDDQRSESLTFPCIANSTVPNYRLRGLNDLENLLEIGDHSDITFKVGQDSFKAHKAIITIRSPVFKAMFKHNTIENQNNEIEVTDIKPEVMKEVLRFIYASKVTDIDKIAIDLLQAAEKYSIQELKLLCEKTLYEDITIENALEYLKMADMYNTVKLKSEVIKFIVKNKKDIIGGPEFKLLVTSHPELFWQVIVALTL